MEAVADCLKNLRLDSYLPILIDNGYDDLDSIKSASEEDLVSIGVKKGHAKKLVTEFSKLSTASVTSPIVSPRDKKQQANEEEDDSDKEESFDTPPTDREGIKPDYEGFLTKKGEKGFIKLWRKRYFRLYENEKRLSYFPNDKTSAETGAIELGGALGVEKFSGKGNAIKIPMKTSARVWYLAADNAAKYEDWMKRLTPLVKPYIPPPPHQIFIPDTTVQDFEEADQNVTSRYDSPESFQVTQAQPVVGDVALCIYNSEAAYVEEIRQIGLDEENAAWIKELPMNICEETFHFSPINDKTASIYEQRFYHDAKTPSGLLNKLIGKEISVDIPRDKNFGEERSFRGEVVYDIDTDSFALHDKETNSVHFLNTKEPISYHLTTEETVDEEILLNPCFYLGFESEQKVLDGQLSYWTTESFEFAVKYNILLDPRERSADLACWFHIKNKSGKTFKNAKIVIQDDGTRKKKEDTQKTAEEPKEESALPVPKLGGFGALKALSALAGGGAKDLPKGKPKLRRYELKRRATLESNKWVQLKWISARLNVSSYDLIHFNTPQYKSKAQLGQTYGLDNENAKAESVIEFVNTKDVGLGLPLPAGVVNVVRKDKSGFGFERLGESNLAAYNPQNVIQVPLQAISRVGATRKQTGFNCDVDKRMLVESFEIVVSNGKEEEIKLVVQDSLYRWQTFEITSSSHPYAPHPHHPRRICWRLTLEPQSTQTIKYTVFYSYFNEP